MIPKKQLGLVVRSNPEKLMKTHSEIAFVNVSPYARKGRQWIPTHQTSFRRMKTWKTLLRIRRIKIAWRAKILGPNPRRAGCRPARRKIERVELFCRFEPHHERSDSRL